MQFILSDGFSCSPCSKFICPVNYSCKTLQSFVDIMPRKTIKDSPTKAAPKRRSGKQREKSPPGTKGAGTSQPSRMTPGQQLVPVKNELPPPTPEEQRKMIAKLHYNKKTGSPEAFNEYNSLDLQGKRAWFYNVYQKDPSLSRFNAHVKQRIVFGTEQSRASEMWLTAKQIMANNGFTDDQHPEYQEAKDALLKGLDERDHENADLAALGWKQYRTVQKSEEVLTGKTKSDVLHLEHEITAKDAKAIRDAFDGNAPEPEPDRGLVTIEPWKKDAMDLEKRLQGLTTKGDKLAREAQKIVNQLTSLVNNTRSGNPLARAQADEIESKMEVFHNAGKDFQSMTWRYNSRTAIDAKVQAEMVDEPMKIYKQHIHNFDKLLSLAKTLLSIQKQD